MKPKFLLLYSPQIFDKSFGAIKPEGSLGLMYLAGALRDKNYDVTILDATVGNDKYTLEETFYNEVKLSDPEILELLTGTPLITNKGSFPVNLHMSFTQKPPGRYILIHGENGLLHWDIQEGLKYHNTYTNEDSFFSSKEFERNQMFLDLMSDFLEALESDKTPLTSLYDILGGQLIVLTMKKSLQTGCIEELITL